LNTLSDHHFNYQKVKTMPAQKVVSDHSDERQQALDCGRKCSSQTALSDTCAQLGGLYEVFPIQKSRINSRSLAQTHQSKAEEAKGSEEGSC
jgi:hypothetical protein